MTDDRMITFSIGGRHLAVSISHLKEVVALGPIEPVPGARPPLEGLMVYRKTGVLPILSLGGALGIKERSEGGLVIVADISGVNLGYQIDGIGGVVNGPGDGEIETCQGMPDPLPAAIKGCIKLGDREIALLQLDVLFGSLLS